MLRVFPHNATLFIGNGLGVLDAATEVLISRDIVGEYTLSFKMPTDNGKWQHLKQGNIVLCEGQLFRVYRKGRKKEGAITRDVKCLHVIADASQKHIPFFPAFIGQPPRSIMVLAFEDTPFTVMTFEEVTALGMSWVTELTDVFDMSKIAPINIVESLIKNLQKGELYIDNYKIALVERIGKDTGLCCTLSNNLSSLGDDEDGGEIVNRLYAYGKNDLPLPAPGYIESAESIALFGLREGYKDFSIVEDPDELLARAQFEFSPDNTKRIDIPNLSYAIGFIELHKIFGSNFRVNIGDSIKIKNSTLNIETTERIVKYNYYPYIGRESSVILGRPPSTYSDILNRAARTSNAYSKTVNSSGEIKVNWLENYIKNLQQTVYDGLIKNIALHKTGDLWEFENDSAIAIVDGVLAIADERNPDGTWNFRAFGNGSGFTADEMKTGTLDASKVNVINLDAQNIVSNTFITQNLYAARGTIAELTVDQLDTSDKVANYLASNKADVNYLRIYDQHQEWITATYATKQHWTTYPQSPVDTATYPYQAIIDAGGNIRLIVSTAKWYYYFGGDTQLKSSVAGKMYQLTAGEWVYVSDATNYSYTTILQANSDIYNEVGLSTVLFAATCGDYVQLTDRNGQPVYWVDDTHTGSTLTANAYPVYIYVYDELVKMVMRFEEIDGVKTPIIVMGAGTDTSGLTDNGKAFVYKDTTGLLLKYVKEASGEEVSLRIGEKGIEGFGVGTIYHDRNAEIKTINTAESVVLTKDILFPYLAKTLIQVTAVITVSAACNVTAKTYIGGNALTLQPTLYCPSAGSYIITYNDIAQYIQSGTKTIAVKLATDTADGTVAMGQATLIIQSYTDTLPTFSNVTLFTATPISATEIDLGWTNPVSSYFTEVEVYRSTTDITGQSRADCILNGSLVYSGALEVYSDTGLTAGTQYYYKVFAKYTVEGTTYYSTGTADSETTLVAPPVLQSAATSTDGTIITLTFDKSMADPTGKHAQFSVGMPEPINQQWSDYANSPVLTSSYPYQCIINSGGTILLYYSDGKLWFDGSAIQSKGTIISRCYISGENWVDQYPNNWLSVGISFTSVLQANYDIYSNSALTTVYFAKTTSDSTPNTITVAALNTDTTKIDLTVTTAITTGQVVTVSYAAGDVTSSDTSPLESFSGVSVTNNVVAPYQQWSGYPQSPVGTELSTYPYQLIWDYSPDRLYASTQPFYFQTSNQTLYSQGTVLVYKYTSSQWELFISSAGPTTLGSYPILQANNDIYTSSTLTTVYFAKTTP